MVFLNFLYKKLYGKLYFYIERLRLRQKLIVLNISVIKHAFQLIIMRKPNDNQKKKCK